MAHEAGTPVITWDTPFQPPPPGVTSNYVNPQTLASEFLAISLILIFLGTTFAVVRIWSNRTNFKISDGFIVAAVFFGIGYSLTCFPYVNYYRHSWDVQLLWYAAHHDRLFFVQVLLFGPTMFFGKEAILLLYFEIFQIKKQMRYVIFATMTFAALIFGSTVILAPVACAPRIGEPWNHFEGSHIWERCSKFKWHSVTVGFCDVILEVAIFAIPIPAVLQLQLSLRQKLQILAVFMTAAFAVAASIAENVFRLKYVLGDNDVSWAESEFGLWVIIEIWVTIIVACMPSFAAFCRSNAGTSQAFFSSFSSRLHRRKTSSESTKNVSGAPQAMVEPQTFEHAGMSAKASHVLGYYHPKGKISNMSKTASYDVETLGMEP